LILAPGGKGKESLTREGKGTDNALFLFFSIQLSAGAKGKKNKRKKERENRNRIDCLLPTYDRVHEPVRENTQRKKEKKGGGREYRFFAGLPSNILPLTLGRCERRVKKKRKSLVLGRLCGDDLSSLTATSGGRRRNTQRRRDSLLR